MPDLNRPLNLGKVACNQNTLGAWSGRLDSNQRDLGPEPSGSAKLPYVQMVAEVRLELT